LPSPSSIAFGIALALGLALAGTGYSLSNVIESRAVVRASLNSALEANASLVGEAKRSKADAAAEAERAMARQRERDGMAAALAELRQALGDDSCAWTPERAQAVDKFLRGN
jgi:DNA invertase Pin-like site-specific DNA recombinase